MKDVFMEKKGIYIYHIRYQDWCETNLADPAESLKAYPLLILNLFPSGLVGNGYHSL